MPSAVIVRAHLPGGLERLRRASLADAAHGVPAHLTLLYPFAEADALTSAVRRSLADVARRHRPFDYRLRGRAVWPDTVYVAVAPTRPFQRLQADLQAAFPAYPIYGRDPGFRFVPHVTIAEGAAAGEQAPTGDPAWRSLPRAAHAAGIDVIATESDGRWRLVWRLRLGSADRMRP